MLRLRRGTIFSNFFNFSPSTHSLALSPLGQLSCISCSRSRQQRSTRCTTTTRALTPLSPPLPGARTPRSERSSNMDAPTSAWSTTSPPPAPNPPLPRSASVGGMRLDSLQRVKQHQDNGSAALNVSASSNSPNALDRFVQLFVQSSSPAASPERTRINASDLAPLDAHPALERRRTRSSSLHWTSRSSNDLHHYGDERNSVEEARKYSISSSTSSYGAPSTRYRRTVEGAGDIGASREQSASSRASI